VLIDRFAALLQIEVPLGRMQDENSRRPRMSLWWILFCNRRSTQGPELGRKLMPATVSALPRQFCRATLFAATLCAGNFRCGMTVSAAAHNAD